VLLYVWCYAEGPGALHEAGGIPSTQFASQVLYETSPDLDKRYPLQFFSFRVEMNRAMLEVRGTVAAADAHPFPRTFLCCGCTTYIGPAFRAERLQEDPGDRKRRLLCSGCFWAELACRGELLYGLGASTRSHTHTSAVVALLPYRRHTWCRGIAFMQQVRTPVSAFLEQDADVNHDMGFLESVPAPAAVVLTGPVRWLRLGESGIATIVGGRSWVIGALRSREPGVSEHEPRPAVTEEDERKLQRSSSSARVLQWDHWCRGLHTDPITALCAELSLVGTACGTILRLPNTSADNREPARAPSYQTYELEVIMQTAHSSIIGLNSKAVATDAGHLYRIDLESACFELHGMVGTGFSAFAALEHSFEVMTATRDGAVRCWDLRVRADASSAASELPSALLASSISAFPRPQGSIPLCMDVDERYVVAGTDCGDVLEWDRRQPASLLRADRLHEGPVLDARSVQCAGGQRKIASCGTDGRVYFGSTAADLGPVVRGGPGADFANSLDIIQTERLIAFGGDAGLVYVYAI